MTTPRKSLSVLYWFRRRPYEPGGDTVALEATLDALRAFHVQGTISQDPTCDLAPYDLVHLYNLCDPYSATNYLLRAVRANKPVVATPLYWSHAQYLAASERGTATTYPELFLNMETPEAQARLRATRGREAELLHDAQQLVLHAAQKILILSNGEGAILQSEFGVPREKLQLTYYGAEPKYQYGDAARFEREFGLRDFVFCAARFEDRKNQIGLIRAWRDETVPLVLAGPVPDPDYFQLCRRAATANVHFIGALTPAQIADAGAAARVHVMASWWEEVGLAALEAGLAGCNLVMTQNGPGREYFGEDCVVCDPADAQSIRAAIRLALERPRATQLAEKIRTHFTWERSAAATREAYAQAVASAFPPTLASDVLGNLAIQFAEQFDRQARDYAHLKRVYRDLEQWALNMQTRLQPTASHRARSLRAALRAWQQRVRVK